MSSKIVTVVSVGPKLGTGYGSSCLDILRMLVRMGHQCQVYSVYGTNGHVSTIKVDDQVIPIFPAEKQCSLDNLLLMRKAYPSDAFVCNTDLFWLRADALRLCQPWLQFVMCDSSPICRVNLEQLKEVIPLRVTQWAKDMMPVPSTYCPLTVDDADYFVEDVTQWSRMTFPTLPHDAKLVSVVSANTQAQHGVERKNWPVIAEWWCRHGRNDPKRWLYLHTDLLGLAERGMDLQEVFRLYGGTDAMDRVIVCGQFEYFSGMYGREWMRRLYNRTDVLLNCARSEGFCLPNAEAGACGAVPVSPKFGAGWEVTQACGGVGIECHEEYYIAGSVKSAVTAEAVEAAVAVALANGRHDGINPYSLEETSPLLELALDDAWSPKGEVKPVA